MNTQTNDEKIIAEWYHRYFYDTMAARQEAEKARDMAYYTNRSFW
jgi:ribosomal protein S21